MSRWIARVLLLPVLLISALVAGPAWAGSAHFVKSATSVSIDGATITVSGKEAGLGDETQVHIVLTATASCINPGDHHPKAANKASVTVAGDFPVQNGRAEFTLTGTASFQPDCTPPMTVVWSPIMITDTEHGISMTL
ncbi:hypothetical protein [Nocardioides jiangxiensis]|uniref:Neocarzinostatin family protein n=1 Tax=Nocardioides jiangxiensis TaxID=3064524 RepID=A0ABT9B543_9ACTN|nr:hypothetical protein [Nocardioides sp. WY-20]MDO7869429.1 hypothetical protein [Nocardioides sp. WY-20]